MLYNGDLNTGLVLIYMVESFRIAEWSSIQMLFECWTKFSLIILSNGGLNTGLPFEFRTSEHRIYKSSLFRCFHYSDPKQKIHLNIRPLSSGFGKVKGHVKFGTFLVWDSCHHSKQVKNKGFGCYSMITI